jgi:N-acetyl-anhydromuramyl-L-alanine amidase AmpD
MTQYKFIPSPNFKKGRNAHPITHIIIHTMQGTLLGTQSWFQNPKSQVSAHYLVGKAGDVIQMVADSNTAWHVVSANDFCVGIEFEDLNPQTKQNSLNDPGWFTMPQITAGAKLVAQLMKTYNVPVDHIIGHNDPFLKQYGNNHADPGPYFPWLKFKALIQEELSLLH